MRPSRLLAPVIGLAGGLALGCVLTLDNQIACGDGFVDRAAGEECDPLVPSSFQNACDEGGFPLGTAVCDPVMCTIDASPKTCATCGDGKIDDHLGEQCDLEQLAGSTCFDGTPSMRCTLECRLDDTLCPTCGNGTRDAGEDCDPAEDAPDFLPEIPCTTLESPFGDQKPWAYGNVTNCEEGCRWDTRNCSFCGDNTVDPSFMLGDGMLTLPEVCDGDQADVSKLAAYCQQKCAPFSNISYGCNFQCSANCLSFADIPDEELDCCRPAGEACPSVTSEDVCCFELDPENEGQEPCEQKIDGMNIVLICK